MDALRITLLGGVRVAGPSGEAVPVPGKKSQALLAYLASHPRGACARDELVALLWEEHPHRRGRHGLRQTLLDLRKALATPGSGVLHTVGDTIAIDLSAVQVDVREFLCLATVDTPEALTDAAALYAGDFLVGLNLGQGAFEEWLMTRRISLHETACNVLLRLARLQSAIDKQSAIDTCRRLILLDALDEEAHRLLARLLVETGRRASALRHLRAYEELCRRELGVALDSETERLKLDIAGATGEARRPLREIAESPIVIPEALSTAVLPFENIGGEPDLEPLCRGLAEDVNTHLAKHAHVLLRRRDPRALQGGTKTPARSDEGSMRITCSEAAFRESAPPCA